MVQKRYFFHASGFDPYDEAAQYRRFVREVARFATTWNVQAQVSAAHENSGADGCWTVTAQAPGWRDPPDAQRADPSPLSLQLHAAALPVRDG
jgi:hypothetical protein